MSIRRSPSAVFSSAGVMWPSLFTSLFLSLIRSYGPFTADLTATPRAIPRAALPSDRPGWFAKLE